MKVVDIRAFSTLLIACIALFSGSDQIISGYSEPTHEGNFIMKVVDILAFQPNLLRVRSMFSGSQYTGVF